MPVDVYGQAILGCMFCITRFGIHIGDRKYLNEYTPFGSVSLWYRQLLGKGSAVKRLKRYLHKFVFLTRNLAVDVVVIQPYHWVKQCCIMRYF